MAVSQYVAMGANIRSYVFMVMEMYMFQVWMYVYAHAGTCTSKYTQVGRVERLKETRSRLGERMMVGSVDGWKKKKNPPSARYDITIRATGNTRSTVPSDGGGL